MKDSVPLILVRRGLYSGLLPFSIVLYLATIQGVLVAAESNVSILSLNTKSVSTRIGFMICNIFLPRVHSLNI